ncbi:MAG TPA: proton-conducting transporter membrane subunit, partial [Clostridia bacterium]|nr:proton-conducting transporter membrane subunit [Clostridia bacterium]
MMINPVLLIAIPLGLAFIAVILKKLQGWILAIGVAANAFLVFFVEKGETAIGGFKLPFAISLVLDDFSFIGVILVNVLTLAAVAVAFRKTEKYVPVILAGLAGLNGMVLTGDMFNLFVFMEITAISAYILSSEGRKPEQSFNYLVIGSIGSVLYLLGLILIYGQTGTLNMSLMAEKSALIGQAAMVLPLVLIFAGIAVEAKLLPMSGWVRGVLGNSNALTGVMFASVYSSAALMVFGRVFSQVLIPG